MMLSIQRLFPSPLIDAEDFRQVLRDSILANSSSYTLSHAQQWAQGFVFPAECYSRDASELESYGSCLHSLSTARQLRRSSVRFNLTRASLCSSLDPDFHTLITLSEGMKIFTSPDFSPNCKAPSFSRNYLSAQHAFNRLQYNSWLKGDILLLPSVVANKLKLHYSIPSWVPKYGKPEGRPIFDPSSGASPLNSDLVLSCIQDEWGPISYPTIIDLIFMVVNMAELYSWDAIVLWKTDLKGAFTLLDVHPSYVHLLAAQLTDNLVMVSLVGVFGWQGTPAAFNVISRVLLRAAQSLIHGKVCVYVDDFMGCSTQNNANHDQAIIHQIAHSLLGPDSVADKDESGVSLDFIGWKMCLKSKSVSMTQRNFNKVLYGFFSLANATYSQVRTLNKLASWSTRYSLVYVWMKPFSRVLYNSFKGYDNQLVYIKLNRETIGVIRLWCASLVLTYLNPTLLYRPLESFTKKSIPSWTIEYDASLTGAGLILSYRRVERLVSSIVFPFFNKTQRRSEFRNSVEFISIVIGICLLGSLGVRNQSILLIGDSITSLSWAQHTRFSSSNSLRSALLYMVSSNLWGFSIAETEYIPSKSNRTDALSRGVSASTLGFPEEVVYHCDSNFNEILKWCDPTLPLFDDDGVIHPTWLDIFKRISSL